MNACEVVAQYRQIGARGVHPVGLVVRLYDALLEDFRRAAEAIHAGKIEGRTAALNHALLILAELEGTLDQERGGQVALHLRGLYRVARALIVEANVHTGVARLERLCTLFLPVRQAWQQAERELSREAPAEPAAEGRSVESSAAQGGTRSWSV